MILACDTSSAICSVAISHKKEIVFKREVEGGQIHIEKLAPFLDEGLEYINAQNQKLEALAIAIGPGSFNGLRIGLATMKALASVLKLPLIPIPSTDGLAESVKSQISGTGRAIIYSHRDFVHFADYELDQTKIITSPTFHYDSWDKLFSPDINHYFGMADRGFGEWLHKHEAADALRRQFHSVQADAGQIALLAEGRRGEISVDLDALEPLYNARYEAKKWVPPSFN